MENKPKPMGEFTRRFQREKANRAVSPDEEKNARKAFGEMKKLQGFIIERKEWLKQRFLGLEEEELKEGPEVGLSFKFAGDKNRPNAARLEFRCRDDEAHENIFLECTIEITGKPATGEHVAFPVERVNEAEAKKFIQDKIFSFVKAYPSGKN